MNRKRWWTVIGVSSTAFCFLCGLIPPVDYNALACMFIARANFVSLLGRFADGDAW